MWVEIICRASGFSFALKDKKRGTKKRSSRGELEQEWRTKTIRRDRTSRHSWKKANWQNTNELLKEKKRRWHTPPSRGKRWGVTRISSPCEQHGCSWAAGLQPRKRKTQGYEWVFKQQSASRSFTCSVLVGPLGSANELGTHSEMVATYKTIHGKPGTPPSSVCINTAAAWIRRAAAIYVSNVSFWKALHPLLGSRLGRIWRLPIPESTGLPAHLPVAGEAASLERTFEDRMFLLFPAGVDGLQKDEQLSQAMGWMLLFNLFWHLWSGLRNSC